MDGDKHTTRDEGQHVPSQGCSSEAPFGDVVAVPYPAGQRATAYRGWR